MAKNKTKIRIFIAVFLVILVVSGACLWKCFFVKQELNIGKVNLESLPIYKDNIRNDVESTTATTDAQKVLEKKVDCQNEGDFFRCSIDRWLLSFLSGMVIDKLTEIEQGTERQAFLAYDEATFISMFTSLDEKNPINLQNAGFWNVRDDNFEKTNYEISGEQSYIYKNEKGWCDGPDCSKPYLVYGVLKNNIFYQITFFGDTELNSQEKVFWKI
ncbi:MAG: hypothetical protein WCT18_01735 [Patescibacteria group bacterium]